MKLSKEAKSLFERAQAKLKKETGGKYRYFKYRARRRHVGHHHHILSGGRIGPHCYKEDCLTAKKKK